MSNRTFLLLVRLLFALECAVGDVVETNDGLVGILDDQELSVVLLPDNVNDTSHDAPSIVHGQIDLGSEFSRLEMLGAQDHVPRGIFDVETGDVSGERKWSDNYKTFFC